MKLFFLFTIKFQLNCLYDAFFLKDALTLQRFTLQTKIELSEDTNNGVPNVRALIQELLTDLFISTYNHQVID